jgi:hypothetical protein
MKDLQKGDAALSQPNTFSTVYAFSHRLPQVIETFIKITTVANHTLWLTPQHYIYVNNSLVAARMVKPGDEVTTDGGIQVAVVRVMREKATGLFNPHTLDGDLFVNGIKTSTYTTAVAPSLAHALLWPARVAYSAGIDVIGDRLDDPSPTLADLLPDGADN